MEPDPGIRTSAPDPTADPAPDPAIFVSDLQNVNIKMIFLFFADYFLKIRTFTSFFKDKKS
jgi:hypothetical protein